MGSSIRPSGENRLLQPEQAFLPPGAATQALQRGLLLRFKKEIPQAIEVIEKSYRLFERSENTLGIASAMIELAWLYGNTQEKVRSEKLFRDAENLIEENNSLPGMHEVRARWLHYKGLLNYQSANYGQALKRFKQALTFADPQGLEAAKIYDSMGVYYERTGDFHRAVHYLKSALLIKTNLREPIHEEAVTCQILGRLYLLYEDYDLAYHHLQRSLEICAELKDEKRKASLKNELIRFFLRCGREKEAQAVIQETQQECQSRHLRIQYAMACFYQVYLHYQHQEYELADKLIQREVFPTFLKYRYNRGWV